MEKPNEPSTRLYVLLARAARQAVVFRRGPSRRVLLLKWDTATDTFVEGQWLKGRIYERRSDLSPSGEKLIYFAGNFKKPYYTWIAVSRPPYLTALAFWPVGSTWTGGGLFAAEDVIQMDHNSESRGQVDGRMLPRHVVVAPLPLQEGFDAGSRRLARDGWELMQKGENWWYKAGSPAKVTMEPPTIWVKKHPRLPFSLRLILHGYSEENGPFEITEYQVRDPAGEIVRPLGRTDWADWDPFRGDLLFAWEGRLYRQPFSDAGPGDTKELIDLRPLRFTERKAPDWALKWD